MIIDRYNFIHRTSIYYDTFGELCNVHQNVFSSSAAACSWRDRRSERITESFNWSTDGILSRWTEFVGRWYGTVGLLKRNNCNYRQWIVEYRCVMLFVLELISAVYAKIRSSSFCLPFFQLSCDLTLSYYGGHWWISYNIFNTIIDHYLLMPHNLMWIWFGRY